MSKIRIDIKMEDQVNNTIQNIFYKMDYGESYENINDGIEWIRSHESSFFGYIDKSNESVNGTPIQVKNSITQEVLCTEYIPDTETLEKILSKTNGKIKWIDINVYQRTQLLNKLAAEIEKSADILSQIEIASRGILGRDTRSKVPLLAQYFYYYSSFAVKYSQENPNWKPEGISIGIISNENVLSNLGLVLAPALAAGYNVVLQAGTTIFPAVAFIIELAWKVGIPVQVIRLIPSDDGNLQPYLSSEHVAILTLLVDLNNAKYIGVNNSNKKILNLSSNKTPVIVFDNADLDSASTSIVDAAWGYQGLLPWSVNTILVQENVFNTFLNKLKAKLKTTKVGLGNNKLVNIASTCEASFQKLNKLINLANSQGIEVFQVEQKSNSFTPTLFVGGKINTNRVLSADEDQDANVVTVLAFRSIDEAINLANNCRQGLAASVWTENIGIVNEATRKLKVNNVWINSHGLTTPEIALCPIKDSGAGYFGGIEGFYEYVNIKKMSSRLSASDLTYKVKSSDAALFNTVKKSQENWYKVSRVNKVKVFQKIADYIQSSKENLSTSTTTEVVLEEWISAIYQCITESNNSFNTMYLDFNVTSTREPLGVIAIENHVDLELQNIKLILGALLEGNAVIFLNHSTNTSSFYDGIKSKLPATIFNVLPYSLSNIQIVSAYKELGAYFGQGINPVYGLLPVKDSKIYKNISNSWSDVYRKVTFSKNVWTNIGKSSTCNLSSN